MDFIKFRRGGIIKLFRSGFASKLFIHLIWILWDINIHNVYSYVSCYSKLLIHLIWNTLRCYFGEAIFVSFLPWDIMDIINTTICCVHPCVFLKSWADMLKQLHFIYTRRTWFWKYNGYFPTEDMQTIPPQFCSRSNERCAMCWIEWKIFLPIFIFWVIIKMHLKLECPQ